MIKKEKKYKLLISIYILFNFYACVNYSYKGSIPAHIKSINIGQIKNESSDLNLSEEIYVRIIDIIVSENIISLSDNNADSKLDIVITDISDKVESYSLDSNATFEKVDLWRFEIKGNLIWYDLVNSTEILSSDISGHAIYNLNKDMSSDGIDNDEDGDIDSQDPDEIGNPRISAKKIAYEKISREVINLLLSTW